MNVDWARLSDQIGANKTEAGRDLFVEVMDETARHLMQFEPQLREEAARLAAVLSNPEDAYTAPVVLAAAKRITHEVCEGSALAPAALGWMVHELLLEKKRALKVTESRPVSLSPHTIARCLPAVAPCPDA